MCVCVCVWVCVYRNLVVLTHLFNIFDAHLYFNRFKPPKHGHTSVQIAVRYGNEYNYKLQVKKMYCKVPEVKENIIKKSS